ncbi:MAG TPA: DUF1622 domain-containing protein [Sphingomicrobium sp.]|nr:DUF1622 domain-containing protein [Sphingomicrobium sp.]
MNLSEQFAPVILTVIHVLELIGVLVIVAGAAIMLALFARRLIRRDDYLDAFHHFRSGFGRAILLGLEFLIAADIISTITIELTLESVISLAALILIRTFLSWSLEVEIEGQWPWQRGTSRHRPDE